MSRGKALKLAEQGYQVFPVRGKTPLIQKWHERATDDPERIEKFWKRDPDADVGIATGGGLVVVDLDVKNGVDGTGTLSGAGIEWEPTTSTRSGGQHIYYRTSEEIRNRAGVRPGVDVRGEGGFVVAYDDVPPFADLPALPEPVARLIREKPAEGERSAAEREISVAGAKAAVEAEVFRVSCAPNGNRNHTLNEAAFNLGQLVGEHIDEDDVREQLAEAAREVGLDDDEIAKTIESGMRGGKNNPRTVTDSEPVGEPQKRGGWTPADFEALFDEGLELEQPTQLARTDGLCLLYPGETHSISGESGSGKSWFVQWATAEALKDGQQVLYLDYEANEKQIARRMLILGCTKQQVKAGLTYINPEVSPKGDEFEEILRNRYALAVVDGVTAALNLSGIVSGNSLTNDNDAVTRWHDMLPKRIAKETGAAVVQVDHVTKSKDNRGGYAIGGQAKRASITGAAYVLTTAESFGRGRSGSFDVYVSKDRLGAVLGDPDGDSTTAGKHVAHVDVQCSDEAVTELAGATAVKLVVRPPSDDAGSALARVMQEISDLLATVPEGDKGLTRNKIQQEVRGSKALVDKATEALIRDGYVKCEPQGQYNYHRLITPYTEFEELL